MLSEKEYRLICEQLTVKNEQCIGKLYDTYGGALYGIVLRIVKEEEAAQEILQDTFTKAWQKGHTFNPKLGRLYTWLLRIARNASINYINSKSFRMGQKIHGAENLVHISDHSRDASQAELFDLKGNVLKLESKYQEVIQKIYFEGYTHRDLSDELGLPLGTIKSRIKIALRELKKVYDFRLSSIAISTFLILNVFL